MEYEDYGIQKSMIIIMLAVFLISIASVSASDVNDTAIASDQTTVEISKNEEIILNQDIEQTNNEEIISQANPGTFTELQGLINLATDGSTLKLNKSYEYDDGFSSEGISIAKSLTIDGQGYKIDAKQKSRIFQVTSENVILKNIIFINAKIEGDGGAVHFGGSGTVENCNFTNNSATSAGGAIHMASGTVENCNFNNNTAGFSGAIRFYNNGTATNCNFTNNLALNNGTATNCNFTNNLALNNGGVIFFSNQGNVTYCNFTNNSDFKDGGAVYFYRNGDVTNCNFINNSASNRGGAIYFSSSGLTDTVTNCNFTGNNANTGSAIYFYRYYSTDVLTVSNSIFLNNRANADALEVNKNDNNITITFTGGNNLLNAIYSEYNAEVSFTNVTYWGSKGIANTGNSTIEPSRSNRAAGQNITVGIVVNDELVLNEVKVTDENGTIVLNINTGENYFIGVRHDADSYYTEAEKTISNNTKFNVNVTSQTTTNKTVNITAKSNIYSEFMPGQLLFILPNGNEINAFYDDDGIWWAVYSFDDYKYYQVTASYTGLSNVTVNNAIISITKADSTMTNYISLEYGNPINRTLTFEGATGITVEINGTPVDVVDNYTVMLSRLDVGTYTLTVTTIPDEDHNPSTSKFNIKVNKADSTLSLNSIVFDYNSTGSSEVSYTGATGFNASVANHPEAIINIVGNMITVSGLDAGTYTLKVTTMPDSNHNPATQIVNITVNAVPTQLDANAVTTTYNINKNLVITLKDSKGNVLSGVSIVVNLNGAKTYTTDKNGQIKVSTKGLAPKVYTAKVTFNGNEKYVGLVKDIKVTVKKATPKLTAKKKTFKKSVKVKKYSITLKDNLGKAIKNAKVAIKIGKKTFNAKTNSKGKATFKIKKLTKKGKYNAKVTYNGNKYYNKVTKKVKINVK